MAAVAIELRWQRAGSPVRIGYVLALAMATHLAIVMWWKISQHPRPLISKPMLVRLLPTPPALTPIEVPVQEPPPGELEVPGPEPITSPPKPVIAEILRPIAQPAVEPEPSAAVLLGSLRKYRLTDEQSYSEEPSKPAIRVLGEPPPGDVMFALQDRLPELPFGSSGLNVAFYSSGLRGDLERFGDAITQEFGFKTRYGTKVQCVLMVVLLVCGWD